MLLYICIRRGYLVDQDLRKSTHGAGAAERGARAFLRTALFTFILNKKQNPVVKINPKVKYNTVYASYLTFTGGE